MLFFFILPETTVCFISLFLRRNCFDEEEKSLIPCLLFFLKCLSLSQTLAPRLFAVPSFFFHHSFFFFFSFKIKNTRCLSVFFWCASSKRVDTLSAVLQLRAEVCRDPEQWALLVEEDVLLRQPLTPYRSHLLANKVRDITHLTFLSLSF